MSNAKHTPGPWEWRIGNWLYGQGEMILWYTTDDDGIHARTPDARLIAAAPDLLEALKDVLARIERSEAWWIDCPDRGGFDDGMIRAAISKATGEQ